VPFLCNENSITVSTASTDDARSQSYYHFIADHYLFYCKLLKQKPAIKQYATTQLSNGTYDWILICSFIKTAFKKASPTMCMHCIIKQHTCCWAVSFSEASQKLAVSDALFHWWTRDVHWHKNTPVCAYHSHPWLAFSNVNPNFEKIKAVKRIICADSPVTVYVNT